MATQTAVRERPILFSAEMVRAILANTKRMTRRVLKRQPVWQIRGMPIMESPRDEWAFESGTNGCIKTPIDHSDVLAKCPYGVPGDQLWVRETWCSPGRGTVGYLADAKCGAFLGDGAGGRIFCEHGFIIDSPAYLRCFKEPARTYGLGAYGGKWRPSIHMPRWASRLTLEIISVRVERLQAITSADARAEGFVGGERESETDAFHNLWDKLNSQRGFSWVDNPWVWAISFRRAEVNS